MKKNHMDFIIFDDKGLGEETIFRFYPKKSNCHSFNENPPKDWKGVYKVYYSYSIILKYYENGNMDGYKTIFKIYGDECSCLTELAWYIRDMIENKKSYIKVSTLGQPGSEWIIEQQKENLFQLTIWRNPDNSGYRFWLSTEKIQKFCEYLDKVNEYMLTHGEPI